MPKVWRTVIVTALVAFAAGILGVYAGFTLRAAQAPHEPGSLDEIVHRELDLSAEQDRQLTEIEERYETRTHALEEEMRTAARELAGAVYEDKAHTPRVQRAVERFHSAMGRLQDDAVAHVFEMRAILTPDQQVAFDEIVRAELLRSVAQDEADDAR